MKKRVQDIPKRKISVEMQSGKYDNNSISTGLILLTPTV